MDFKHNFKKYGILSVRPPRYGKFHTFFFFFFLKASLSPKPKSYRLYRKYNDVDVYVFSLSACWWPGCTALTTCNISVTGTNPCCVLNSALWMRAHAMLCKLRANICRNIPHAHYIDIQFEVGKLWINDWKRWFSREIPVQHSSAV